MTAGYIRIGVLTPHAAPGAEAEFPAMAPGRVVTCVARVPAEAVDVAADMFGQGSVAVIAHASTSTGYSIGFDESAFVSRLSRRVRTPVVATCASAVAALRVLGVERVALVHPPWFDAELNALGAAYYRGAGLDVVSSQSAALSRDPARIDAEAVCSWTARNVGDDAEAVFIGGNGFRATGAIEALEAAIGRPVLTSNQVLLWGVLARVGDACEVSGFGQLFAHRSDESRVGLMSDS